MTLPLNTHITEQIQRYLAIMPDSGVLEKHVIDAREFRTERQRLLHCPHCSFTNSHKRNLKEHIEERHNFRAPEFWHSVGNRRRVSRQNIAFNEASIPLKNRFDPLQGNSKWGGY